MKKKYVIYSLVIILTVIQCYVLIKYNKVSDVKEINANESNSISEVKNVKYIKKLLYHK